MEVDPPDQSSERSTCSTRPACFPRFSSNEERVEGRFGEATARANILRRFSSWDSSPSRFFSSHKSSSFRRICSDDSGRATGQSRSCSESSSHMSYFSSCDTIRSGAKFYRAGSSDVFTNNDSESDDESPSKLDGTFLSRKETTPFYGRAAVCRKLVDFMPGDANSSQSIEDGFSVCGPTLSQDFLSLDLLQSGGDEHNLSSSTLENSGYDSDSQEGVNRIQRAMSLPSVSNLDALFHAPLIDATPIGKKAYRETCITPFGQTTLQGSSPSPYQLSSAFHALSDVSTSPDHDRSFCDQSSPNKELMETVLHTPVSYGKRQHQDSPRANLHQPSGDVPQLTAFPFLQSGNSTKRTRESKLISKGPSPLKLSNMERFSSISSPKLNSAFGIGCKQADLIGDLSRPHRLPLLSSEGDLKRISCGTLYDLLKGRYQSVVQSYIIIDCRYPYEYEGGHIKGAVNFATTSTLIDHFMNTVQEQENVAPILIFHCEFSLKRSLMMLRDLRRDDRNRNGLRYPALRYPEIYLLDGGYCKFFEHCKDQCVPQQYVKMLDEAHTTEFQMFQRSKSFSEGCEPPARVTIQRHRTCLRF